MNAEERHILQEVNEQHAITIDNRIKEKYIETKRTKVAGGVSVGLMYLGYGIGITLFQNLSVIALSGQRKYSNLWWIALLGFNPLFFLFFGEQKRFNKYYEKEWSNIEVPIEMNEYLEGFERVKQLSNQQIDVFKNNNLYTTDNLGEQKFEVLGMVYGSSVRSKNAFSDIGAGIKSIKGGKLQVYKKLMDETREDALDNLIINSTRDFKEFDAIINIRMGTSDVAGGASEVMVYGTVVKFKGANQ